MRLPRLVSAAGLAAVLSLPNLALAQDAPKSEGPKPEEIFARLDKNGDGKVTADEVPDDQKRFFERSVRVGDKDADGALSKDEFVQANRPGDNPNVPLGPLGGPGGGRPGEDLKRRFESMDTNKDGKLSKEEIPAPLRERLAPLFERLGKDEINYEEFGRMAGGGPGVPRFDPGDMFRRLDVNGDDKISKDEIPEPLRDRFAPLFERLGKNEVGREEFLESARQTLGLGQFRRPEGVPGQPPADGEPRRPGAEGDGPGRPSGPPLPTLIRLLDENGDGRLSRSELVKATDHFSRLDENADGYIDPAELIGFPRGGPGLGGGPGGGRPFMRGPEGRPDGEGRPGPEGRPAAPEGSPRRPGPEGPGSNRFFAQMDRNGDGKLSKEEAPDRMKENFDRMDKDGDGSLTQEELRAAFEQFGGQRPQRPGGERPRRPESETPPQ